MLDWLEHILSILTAAQQEEDELNEWLLPHPLILPLKQTAQNNTAEDTDLGCCQTNTAGILQSLPHIIQ